MQNAWRIGIGAAVVVAAVVLFVVLRQGDDSSASTPTTPTEAVTDTGTATEPVPTDTAPTDTGGGTSTGGGDGTFRIDVPQGGPTEIQELDVKQGQKVVIVVTAGDHDNIHLHGYDILLHTGPGLPPARFEFTATTPGSFEIEQEEAGKQIAELNVTP